MSKKLFTSAAILALSLQTATSISQEDDATKQNINRLYERAISQSTPDYSDKRVLVKNYYAEFLKRSPDNQGWDDWVNYINSNGCNAETLREVVQGFTLSSEFQRQISWIKLTKSVFEYQTEVIMRAFRGALQRNPEKTAFDYYMDKMDAGYGWASRDVVLDIINSNEFNIRAQGEWCS